MEENYMNEKEIMGKISKSLADKFIDALNNYKEHLGSEHEQECFADGFVAGGIATLEALDTVFKDYIASVVMEREHVSSGFFN